MKLSKLQNKLSQSESYTPAEDTFFFAEYLKDEAGQSALDIGTGSGYLAKILSSKFSHVVATDISFSTLRDQKPKLDNCICCDAAEPILGKFDLIVCNLPYLPSEEITDITIDGGKDGFEIPQKIFKSALNCLKDNGKFLFLTSSLANFKKLIEFTQRLGFDVNVVGRKKLFYEELILVKAKK